MVDRYNQVIQVGDRVAVVWDKKPCIGNITDIYYVGKKERATVKLKYNTNYETSMNVERNNIAKI